MKIHQKGFTLVEIAIVLVIIGLLLGGILKGQEMIVQAKIKNAMADFSGISAAYHGYQDRYRKIPGDDDGAARWAGAPIGNGNGVVEGAYNVLCAAGTTVESCLWWQHLRLAGFVAGNGASQPTNAFAGQLGVQTGNGGAIGAITPVMNGFASLLICSANIPDKVAIAIDTSMDDGISSTGGVRAELQTSPNPPIGSTSAAYAETGTNIYVMCRQI
jgi:prepilin-type N-terminal cleavage/methylation domain-containing protein